ncbi:hypothetical protein O181_014638 [Austropuccinia psidii MF-1]|uniref:Uncharacterized protein n=1 Tax=Austropuccinia psidii MF-1 TaxID=1389203 RepID=A0A9Q3GP77_9BASI|nr:hypothetical protein [Austropuccinia psidii MF-1]
MNFHCFSTHEYVDPDDPLTEPHPGVVIEQQNRQISILQQQLQQSQTAYHDILEKIKSLEVDKQKKASKSQLPPLKLYKSSKLPVKKKSDNCSHKSNPYQLVIANTPPDFQYTKDSFYIHIKVLWDMVHEHSVPIAPKISTLKEFSNRFKNAEEIKKMAESDTGVPLIAQSEVLTLKGVEPGRKKVGRGIVYIKEFFILYIQALLSKLGIRQWAPNLEEASDTL